MALEISPGEILDIFVLKDESFNGRYLVRPGGDIILPKIGRVNLAGKTLASAEKAIQAKLSVNQLRGAKVIVDRASVQQNTTAQRGITIFLTGKVVRPGRLSLLGIDGEPPTAYQAILDAGGFSRFANKKKCTLLRKDPSGRTVSYPLDFVALRNGTAVDIPLQSGDTIIVPEKKIGF